MAYLLPIFKAVSIIFAVSAVATGSQAVLDPIGFSEGFGLVLVPETSDSVKSLLNNKDAIRSGTTATLHNHRHLAMSYISLMGVRQLATGIILLTFAYQNKWAEIAIILAVIGVVVAGTDGLYLSRAGDWELGLFHAIPGVLIAALAAVAYKVIHLNT